MLSYLSKFVILRRLETILDSEILKAVAMLYELYYNIIECDDLELDTNETICITSRLCLILEEIKEGYIPIDAIRMIINDLL